MRATSAAILLAGVAISLGAVGCAETVNNVSNAALDQQLCTESDLGGSYIEKTSGTFSTENLASLASDASTREAQLTKAGADGGKFAYWVHTVPNPPFTPPLEAVCQVLAFGNAQQAQAFVRNMRPTADDLASSAIAWLAHGQREVKEINEPSTNGGAESRAFLIRASGNDVSFTIYAVVEPAGRFVRTVYLGNNGTAASLGRAQHIVDAIGSRTGNS